MTRNNQLKKMGVGGIENRVEVLNVTIDMDNNNGGDKDSKDWSKEDEDYGDGDDDDNEDNDNDDGEDNDDKNINATDSEESDDGKGENDEIDSATALYKRFYTATKKLRNKCEKADIECGILGLVVPKKVTNKEPIELSIICCHNKYGQLHLKNCTVLDNCCHRYWTIDSTASYSGLAFLRCCFLKVDNRRDSDMPQIVLNWSRHMDIKGIEYRDVSSAINRFLTTTIGAGHLKKVHRDRRLSRVLIGTKETK